MITLQLKAKHFFGSNFHEIDNCSISISAKEHFSATWVHEVIEELYVEGRVYKHSEYFKENYLEDLAIAQANNFNDFVVRELELTPL